MPDLEQIQQYDTKRMLPLLQAFWKQCRHASEIADDFQWERQREGLPNHVVIAGVGGSAIGGDLAKAVLADQSPVPILVNRNYTLPAFISNRTLLIAVSYSGNTEETLQTVETAHAKGAEIIAITSGGQLQRFAEKYHLPCIRIPVGQQPRGALGYLFIPILAILNRLGCAPHFDFHGDLKETVELLAQSAENFAPHVSDSLPKQLARQLYGKLPIIYAPQELHAVAVRWTGQITETSKSLAYCNVYPEMNHNEIEGWKYPPNLTRQCHVVQLRDSAAHPQTQRRMDITAELIREHAAGITEVHSQGESFLARIFSLLAIVDWTSFYLAILYAQDPPPIDRIHELKRRLAQ